MEKALILNLSLEEFRILQQETVNLAVKQALKEHIERINQEDTLLNRKEAASFLKISLVTLNKYTKEGRITCQTIGGRILYKKSDLINSLNNSSTHEKS